MDHPLLGVDARLERGKDNIINFKRGIDTFLAESGNSINLNDHLELAKKFIESHSSLTVPKRFSVLAGEVVHLLRSSLDHLAWQLVLANGGKPNKKTAFPIFNTRPTEDKSAQYNKKVEGMSVRAKELIEILQPYHHPGKLWRDDWLWIIYDMDNIDKHRELIVVNTTVERVGTYWFGERGGPFATFRSRNPSGEPRAFFGPDWKMNVDEKIIANIAFRQFGKRENQEVIPSLSKLFNLTLGTVDLFRREFS